ncbi:MAG: hypothetical protein MUE36_11645 [Acidimicrobiales bacterium]|nr:hypothetical protein [Acidimicrobiales bacterium]
MTAASDPTLHAEGVSPVAGSEAALLELRREIARLGADLVGIEAETAALREFGPEGRPEPVEPDMSAVMAEELATATVARERAEMARFLDGTEAACEARLAEARREAGRILDAARDDLADALVARGEAVEAVLVEPPAAAPVATPSAEDVAEGPGPESPAESPADGSPIDELRTSPDVETPTEVVPERRRVTGALRGVVYAVLGFVVVLLVTQVIVVLLAVLD